MKKETKRTENRQQTQARERRAIQMQTITALLLRATDKQIDCIYTLLLHLIR